MGQGSFVQATCSTAIFAAVMLGIPAPIFAAEDAESTCRERYLTGMMATPFPGRMTFAAPPAPAAAAAASVATPADYVSKPSETRDAYPAADPNIVRLVVQNPVSTFGADVDTVSYTLARRYLMDRDLLPPADAVRPEEIINALDYHYPAPKTLEEGFAPLVSIFPAPWDATKKLLSIGIKAFTPEERPPLNLVALLDVSGSMAEPDRLPLAKASLCLLVSQLDERDRVGVVTYAGTSGVALRPTSGANKETILRVLDRLQAGGSTAGFAGLQTAYQMAEDARDEAMISRIVLATDGDFNVGFSDPRQLRDFIIAKRDDGVFLNVLGYGMGNYHDTVLQALAQNGNGIAGYIGGLREAKRLLVDNFLGSMVTVARDVKFQVEFNPARVFEYRLIGYETRVLNQTDFSNDRVDSGDLGAGQTVTALYELALAGSNAVVSDPLRYGGATATVDDHPSELGLLRIRFKPGEEQASRVISVPITDDQMVSSAEKAPADLLVATAAGWFGEMLRKSPYTPVGWMGLASFAARAFQDDPLDGADEINQMIDKAAKLTKVAGR
jgi:Ca-activated chloride channel family protein